MQNMHISICSWQKTRCELSVMTTRKLIDSVMISFTHKKTNKLACNLPKILTLFFVVLKAMVFPSGNANLFKNMPFILYLLPLFWLKNAAFCCCSEEEVNQCVSCCSEGLFVASLPLQKSASFLLPHLESDWSWAGG